MKTAKNIILIIALSAVIIMVILIALYDYFPSSTTVAEPNTYETDGETTKVLSEITSVSSQLSTDDETGTSGSIILKSYSITETDLALYTATDLYDPGRADPFSAVSSSSDSSSSSSSSSSSNSSSSSSSSSNSSSSSDSSSSTSSNTSSDSSSSTSSDGTLFNSTSTK